MWRDFISPLISSGACTLIVFTGLHVAVAQEMLSNNYRIQSDSINFSGGFSSSSNYVLESTAGEVGTGEIDSSSYSLKAGYQQMQEVYIAITGAATVSMSPSIPGVTGGNAYGSTTVTVTSDSSSGYALTIAAEDSPAMQKGADTIADYVPVGIPDLDFDTGAADAHFGYSPEGSDIVQRFKDNGAVCNVDSLDTSLSCWDGLSTSEETISSDSGPNHPAGATTTIQFQVGVGGSVVQAAGVYTATTTLTALPL